MLVAHLPAGYLATKLFLDKTSAKAFVKEKTLWATGLFFSILPDLDLLYFYLVDSSQHHHKLFPHLPI